MVPQSPISEGEVAGQITSENLTKEFRSGGSLEVSKYLKPVSAVSLFSSSVAGPRLNKVGSDNWEAQEFRAGLASG